MVKIYFWAILILFLLQETMKEKRALALLFLGQIGVQPGYWNENFHVLPDDDENSMGCFY